MKSKEDKIYSYVVLIITVVKVKVLQRLFITIFRNQLYLYKGEYFISGDF